MMEGLNQLAMKKVFLVMMGGLLVTMLLSFDYSGWHISEVRQCCDEDQISGQCKNCLLNRRFKTPKILYNGGRELHIGMLENITVLTENQCKQKKFLVYKCDSSQLCGGLADRQKGIVATFLMALLTNRIFVINMTSPCMLEEYLLPNIYNWSLCKEFLKTVPKQNISTLNYIQNYNFSQGIKQFDFERNWNKAVVAIRINTYIIDGIKQHKAARERSKWLLDMHNEEIIHLVLNTLFKPNGKLLNDAIYFHDNRVRGKRLICCHIRKGKNPSIPTDNKLKFGAPNETMIFDYLKEHEDNSKNVIYIATDSSDVKESARGNLKSYITINRTIVHVDRLGKFKKLKVEACEGLYSAILEQFILSLCNKLILTRSGFGTMAAYMRGESDNLYIYHPKKKQIIKTNLTGIQRVFKFL